MRFQGHFVAHLAYIRLKMNMSNLLQVLSIGNMTSMKGRSTFRKFQICPWFCATVEQPHCSPLVNCPYHVSALKAKVARILDGNIRLGFSGPKSRLVSSDSGTQPHSVSAVGIHKYACDSACMQFKSRRLRSHTLAAAADNKDLQEFVDAYLSGSISHNATPAATAGGNKFAGRKPGDAPRVRKKGSEPVAARCTLGEVLSDIPQGFSQLQYQSQPQGGLKMVFTRVSAQRPPKPAASSTNDKPFQLIEIQGNIRKCFGCGLPLGWPP